MLVSNVMLALAAVFAGGGPATTLYVSPDGDDAGDGSLARPFLTLTRARDAVRLIRRPLPPGGVAVHLRAGVHHIVASAAATAVLELTAEDSGAADAPIVWRAHHGEEGHVLVSAGLPVPTSAFSPVPASFSHSPGNSHVLQANLTALGARELGGIQEVLTPRQGGPANFSWPMSRPELFFQRRPMTLAQWPNLCGPNRSITWAQMENTYRNAENRTVGFTFNPATQLSCPATQPKLAEWAAEAASHDPWLHGYWQWDFADGYIPMAALSLTGAGLPGVSVGAKIGTGFQNDASKIGARFYALNLKSELDAVGEYYIERSNGSASARAQRGMLFFMPPPAAGELSGVIDGAFVSQLPAVISLSNQTSFVRFEDLRLEHSTGSAVQGPGPARAGTISSL